MRVRVAGEARLAAVEDAAALRDALGVSLPIGLPGVFTEPTERPLETLVARYARTHAPFLASQAAARLGAGVDRVRAALDALEASGRVTHGEFRPADGGRGVEREWCDVDVLRRLRRRSLAALRKEVEPVDASTLGRFLPAWQGLVPPSTGPDALMDAIARLQGAAVPASILEHDVLPARVRGFRPVDLDALCASGDLVWIGAGPLGADDGRVSLYVRDQVRLLAPPPPEEPPTGPLHVSIREHLARHGASFWPDLVQAAGTGDERVVLSALWDLVWAGEVTNDTLAPLRALTARRSRATPRPGSRPRPGALRRTGPPAGAGRWSLVAPLLEPPPSPTEVGARASPATARPPRRAHPRGGAVRGRARRVRGCLRRAEGVGDVRQGPARLLRRRVGRGAVRRAGRGRSDPGLPGVGPWRRADGRAPGRDRSRPAVRRRPAVARGAGRPARQAGAFVVLVDGELAAFLERGARSLLTFGVDAAAWADALATLPKDGRLRKIELTRIDGGPADRLADRRPAARGRVHRRLPRPHAQELT